jgi:hypothetical protein
MAVFKVDSSRSTPAYALFSLALVIVSWWMPRQQRKWALVAGLSGIIVLVATLLFFLPILEKTQVTRGAGLNGEEITRLVNQFKTWHWGRWAVLIGGWAAGQRALSLSPSADVRSSIPQSNNSGDGVTGGVVFLGVEDVDALHKERKATGVIIDLEPTDQKLGQSRNVRR